MSSQCKEVSESLGKPRASLAEAQRLVLERHLSECADCRHTADLLRVVTSMVLEAPAQLDERARERALRGAFAVQHPAQHQPSRSRVVQLGLALAVAAALLLGLRSLLQQEAPQLAQKPAPNVQPVAQPTAPVADPVEPAWLQVEQTSTRQFAHASVVLAEGSRVRFSPEKSTLELAEGRVDVDVDASRGMPFEVLTQGFRVLVMGTQFTVTPERVSVTHGHVRVFALDGTQLADLHDRGAYPRVEQEKVAAHERVGSLLTRARAALSSGQLATARELVKQAERVAVEARDRAEAGTLAAECALVAGQPAEAVRAYLTVATRFAALPAGENALFAAAQLTARGADAASAHKLFERYLRRYPRGRFADEARARIALH